MVLFEAGGVSIFGIQLYAICILIGIIIAVVAGIKEGKKLGLWTDFVLYGVLICVPLAIIGARLWYVLFNLSQFSSFGEVLGFSNGHFVGLSGLAIQGGVIAALIGIFFYSKKTKVSLYKIFDITAPGFFIGQIFGRWGNFFNNELYGPIVKNVDAFKIIFPSFITDNMYINGAYHHPTFLYESSLNLIGLIIMLVLRRKSKKLQSGDLMGIYLVWYGMVRIFTETLRIHGDPNDPLMLGPIPVSILVSVLFIIIGLIFLILKHLGKGIKKGEPYYLILEEVKKNKVNTILFDLDGTLLDTKELIDRSFIYTFSHFYPEMTLTSDMLDSFFGPTLYDTFSRFTDDDEKIKEMIEYYREFNKEHHDEYVKPFESVRETLRVLHKKGYQLGVVSSKNTDMVEYGLTHTKIRDYIDVLVCGDDVSKPKPSAEGILKAEHAFSHVTNTIYVGDAPTDIMAGKNANVKTAAVMYTRFFDEIDKLEPDYYLSKLEDLFKILGE